MTVQILYVDPRVHLTHHKVFYIVRSAGAMMAWGWFDKSKSRIQSLLEEKQLQVLPPWTADICSLPLNLLLN